MRKLLVALLAFALLATGSPAHASTVVDKTYVEGTDKQAFLFNPLVVNRIDLAMTPTALDALRNDLRTNQPATITLTTALGKTKTYSVGVHVKGGWGSFRSLDEKAAFKIKVDYSVKDQSIYGIKKFTLNNMVQDPSMLHEAISYRLFRALGVAAPRVGYADVYLNGINYGLHSNIETYDLPMLSRWFPAGTEHLLEGAYEVEVGPELEVDEGSKTDLSDVIELKTWNDQLSGKAWYDKIRTKVNLNQMIMNWAVEHYIGHWDGYTRGWPNNYYLHKAKNGMFTMHPWGTDQTWIDWNGLIDDGATMMTRCVYYEPCRDLYLKALAQIELKLPSLKLSQMVDKVWEKISPSIWSDPRKPYSNGDSYAYMAATKSFIDARYTELQGQNGSRKVPVLSISYPTSGFQINAVLKPKVTKTGTGSLTFTRLDGVGVCNVDSENGSIMILSSGVCQVAVQISKTDGYHSAMTTLKVSVPKLASRVIVAKLPSVAFGKSITISTLTDSTGRVTVKWKSGKCSVSGKSVKALATSGKCIISVSVAGDSRYLKATKYYAVTLRK